MTDKLQISSDASTLGRFQPHLGPVLCLRVHIIGLHSWLQERDLAARWWRDVSN